MDPACLSRFTLPIETPVLVIGFRSALFVTVRLVCQRCFRLETSSYVRRLYKPITTATNQVFTINYRLNSNHFISLPTNIQLTSKLLADISSWGKDATIILIVNLYYIFLCTFTATVDHVLPYISFPPNVLASGLSVLALCYLLGFLNSCVRLSSARVPVVRVCYC